MPESAHTVSSVFGSDNPPVQGSIPDPAFDALLVTIEKYKLGDQRELVKQKYVEFLNNPKLAVIADAKHSTIWLEAVAALRGYFSGTMFGPKAHRFAYLPISVSQPVEKKADQRRAETTYSVFLWGLAASKEADLALEGPASLAIFGFPTKADAQRVSDGIVPKRLYLVRAKLGDRSPVGAPLSTGAVANLNGNWSDPIEVAPAAENGGPWADPLARIEGSFPLSTFRDLLTHPVEPYRPYRVLMSVNRGFYSPATDKRGAFGILSGVDDSISADSVMLEGLKGGVGLFLPKEDMPLTRLGPGSLVSAIITGKQVPETDKNTGNPTGKVSTRWSASYLRVVADLTPEGALQNPAEVAVSLPSKPAGPGPQTRRI